MKNFLLTLLFLPFCTVLFAQQPQLIDELSELCDDGKVEVCTRLGQLYYHGTEVKRDFSKAKKFFQKACDLGDGLGCSFLGTLYEQGRGGLEQSYRKAQKNI